MTTLKLLRSIRTAGGGWDDEIIETPSWPDVEVAIESLDYDGCFSIHLSPNPSMMVAPSLAVEAASDGSCVLDLEWDASSERQRLRAVSATGDGEVEVGGGWGQANLVPRNQTVTVGAACVAARAFLGEMRPADGIEWRDLRDLPSGRG